MPRKLRAVDANELAPELDGVHSCDHSVQFYETETFLTRSVAEFIAGSLEKNEGAIVVATQEHRAAIDELLGSAGIDVEAMRNGGSYITLDAAQTLETFMKDASPDVDLFKEIVGGVIERAASGGKLVRIFGEMVALLWAEGNVPAAISLEEMWDELGETYDFSLLCAYPMQGFNEEDGAAGFYEICARHSSVIPTESYVSLPNADQRLRAITFLQQKASSDVQSLQRAAAIRQREALELNQAIVQGLATAKMALELNEYAMLETAVADTLKRASEIVSDLLDQASSGQALNPGDLRHFSS
jgi:MEDS: MEthanogen/methylotroph, DcmR Sensory domain